MSRLTNKTILITGASSGIGRSTAYEFSRTAPNIRLILTARRIDTLRQIATDLETSSGGRTKVLPLRFDVSSPSSARGFLSTLPENWRDIDVLVNNAGLVKGADKVGEIKEEDIDVMMTTNVLGLINVRAPSLPHPLSFTRR
jgi:3-hydroxy acid dehydrogenase/malonic semialdehyde reductase